MTGQSLVLAVDIGTSGARAVWFDEYANHLSHVRMPYDLSFPQPGWAEQNPEIVVTAVIEALRQAVASIPAGGSLEAIVLSSQMYSILALDSAGVPCSNSLTWGDTRSARQAAAVNRPGLVERTGCPVQAIYPLAKILWLKANANLPGAVIFASIKDYVLFRLTGYLLADWSTASASGLLNISRYQWDDEALSICGITASNLPALVSTRHMLRCWQPDISRHVGIPDDTPLIVGAGDAPLANIGVGAVAAGTLAVNIGTSAAARVLVSQPQVDGAGRLWTYVADVDRWVMGGIIGSGGAVYEWILRRLLFADRDLSLEQLFQEADRLAGTVPPGAGDLLFLPYFSGEQSPGWNSESKGTMYGMTFQHEPRHYIRAAIEGIIFSLLRVAEPIQAVRNTATHTVYLTGGLAASPVWPQILADVFGASVSLPRSPESSARGAAILGWLTLGRGSGYEEFAPPEDRLYPNADNHALYRQCYRAYCSLNSHVQAFLHDKEIDRDYRIADA